MFLRLRRGIVQPAGGTRSPLRFAGAPQPRYVERNKTMKFDLPRYEIVLFEEPTYSAGSADNTHKYDTCTNSTEILITLRVMALR